MFALCSADTLQPDTHKACPHNVILNYLTRPLINKVPCPVYASSIAEPKYLRAPGLSLRYPIASSERLTAYIMQHLFAPVGSFGF